MQVSIVNYSEVKQNTSFRIDAEHFKKEYLLLQERIKKHNYQRLGDFETSIYHPKEIKRSYVEKGTLFFRTQNVRPLKINLANQVFISQQDAAILAQNAISRGDILITRTGANFGDTAIFLENIEAIASSHVFIVRSKKLNHYFLTIFLNTVYGRKLIDKGMYGSVQPEIAPYYLLKIPIPVFTNSFTNRIESLVKSSRQSVNKSKQLYEQAEHLLLSELGLTDWRPKHRLAFVKSFSDVQDAERIDAEYFQPKYDEIVDTVKSYKGGWDTLGNLVSIKKGTEPGRSAYQESGIPFVRVRNLSKFEITDDNQQYISEELYRELIEHQPEQNEILLSKDATPGIAYHLKDKPDRLIHSGGILRLTIKNRGKISEEYLTLVLNSIIVQQQILRDAGGSLIKHWRLNQVKNTIIPILAEEPQKEIQSKIELTFNQAQLSKQLLAIAKRGVEMAIEQDEEIAEKWIETQAKSLGVHFDNESTDKETKKCL